MAYAPVDVEQFRQAAGAVNKKPSNKQVLRWIGAAAAYFNP
jgi:hypothetical protein